MGLGSIVGTGIIIAIVTTAILATFNGLRSAHLAAAHLVSGGTYEYGYRFLGSYFGFTAGWMFLVAKSADCRFIYEQLYQAQDFVSIQLSETWIDNIAVHGTERV